MAAGVSQATQRATPSLPEPGQEILTLAAPRWQAVHVFALNGIAIAQPMLSLLGDNATFFVAHDTTPTQAIIFALFAIFAVPVAVTALVTTTRLLSTQVADVVHLTAIGGLATILALQIIGRTVGGPWIVQIMLGLVTGAAVLWLYGRVGEVRSFLSILGLAPIAFVLLFLFASDAESIVFPDDVQAVAAELLIPEPLSDASDVTLDARFPDVYMLVLDEFPAWSLLDGTGQLDAVRFPNFARLAEASTHFTNVTTTASFTQRAVPSILTGRNSSPLDPPVYSAYPENLFTLLGGVYDVSVVDDLVDLCPPNVCNGKSPIADDATPSTTVTPEADAPPQPPATPSAPFWGLIEDAAVVMARQVVPDDLDVGLPMIDRSWGSFSGDGVVEVGPPATEAASPTTTERIEATATGPTDALPTPIESEAQRDRFLESLTIDDQRVADFERWLGTLRAADHPQLRYYHLLLPHVPWRYRPDGTTYADLRTPGYANAWDDDEYKATLAQQRHLLQLGFTDQLVGEFLDRLDEEGLFEDALVVVVADHGIAFSPGDLSREPNEATATEISTVPLFIKSAGRTDGAIDTSPRSVIDIVPLILDDLDLEAPWTFEGTAADPPADRERTTDSGVFVQPLALPPDTAPEQLRLAERTAARFPDGELYALGGRADLIGTTVDRAAGSGRCWREDGEQSGDGLIFGELRSDSSTSIPYAIALDGVIIATARTYLGEVPHRIFAVSPAEPWLIRGVHDVTLYELRDDRLLTIDRC